MTGSGTGEGTVTGGGTTCTVTKGGITGNCQALVKTSTPAESNAEIMVATPGGSSTFAGWSGTKCSGMGTCKVDIRRSGLVPVPEFVSIKAGFNRATQYFITLSASPTNGGSVSGGGTYNANSAVSVTATAAAGYTFSRWTEDGGQVSANATYPFTATASRNLVAVFTQNPVVQPQLHVEATEIAFSVNVNVSTVAQGTEKTRVQNSGGGTLIWSSSSSASWLTMSPATGSLGPGVSQEVTISWNLTGIQKGVTQTGNLTISAPGAVGSPKTVQVRIGGFQP